MFKHRIFCKDEIETKFDIDISKFLRINLQKLSTQEIINIFQRIKDNHKEISIFIFFTIIL